MHRSIARLPTQSLVRLYLAAFFSSSLIVLIGALFATVAQIAVAPGLSLYVISALTFMAAVSGYFSIRSLTRAVVFKTDEYIVSVGLSGDDLVSALKRTEALQWIKNKGNGGWALEGGDIFSVLPTSAERISNLQGKARFTLSPPRKTPDRGGRLPLAVHFLMRCCARNGVKLKARQRT